MEKRKFEDSFKDAFNEAEVGPSDNVWTNIELELEIAAGEKTRRKLFFYKMLAAASITFALLATSAGLYFNNKSERALQEMTSRVSAQPQTTPATAEENLIGSNGASTAEQQKADADANRPLDTKASLKPRANNVIQSSELAETATQRKGNKKLNEVAEADRITAQQQQQQQQQQQAVGQNKPNVQETLNVIERSDTGVATNAEVSGNDNKSNALITGNSSLETLSKENALAKTEYSNRELPHLYSPKAPTIAFKKPEADPVAVMMARLALEESLLAKEDKKEKEAKGEKVWTSVGFAAGGFNSFNHSVSSPPPQASFLSYSAATATTSAADKQAKASGVTYSMGVSVGTKLSKRWILQSGINYLTQSSDYVANNVVADNNYQSLKAESINSLGKIPLLADAANSDQRLAPTAPYSVNNNVKFFSVPVQAGYLVVNRKFGVQLNAGLSSDFFLQNTITPQSGSLDKTTQGSGENSPYRTINFSGLMGTEFTYRLGQRYRLALNPGIRYPLNSVYKSDVGVQSTPVTFDVGLRFRYIFQ